MSVGRFIGVKMPLASHAVYPEDAVLPLNQSKIKGARMFTNKGLHKQIGTYVQS